MQTARTSHLKTARLRKRLSQDRFAAIVGVSKSAVSGWENQRECPSASRLAAIDDALRPHLNLRAYLRELAQAAKAA
jgi:transcriptional regulator with XRE-family HTH domain